ncbi:hypothetical protein M413DRAFT_14974 [Hebeloma cylindrosporum]|uniref:Uncharacterized protein n=1 Tax=Hebeloma cylindrosporum TaxID=76867 RepID=A0A0C2X9D4_HEBCY|nr:hypothetical protein M413DRAFT_14974 [Hebeloma cylindrosporum h7]
MTTELGGKVFGKLVYGFEAIPGRRNIVSEWAPNDKRVGDVRTDSDDGKVVCGFREALAIPGRRNIGSEFGQDKRMAKRWTWAGYPSSKGNGNRYVKGNTSRQKLSQGDGDGGNSIYGVGIWEQYPPQKVVEAVNIVSKAKVCWQILSWDDSDGGNSIYGVGVLVTAFPGTRILVSDSTVRWQNIQLGTMDEGRGKGARWTSCRARGIPGLEYPEPVHK